MLGKELENNLSLKQFADLEVYFLMRENSSINYCNDKYGETPVMFCREKIFNFTFDSWHILFFVVFCFSCGCIGHDCIPQWSLISQIIKFVAITRNRTPRVQLSIPGIE